MADYSKQITQNVCSCVPCYPQTCFWHQQSRRQQVGATVKNVPARLPRSKGGPAKNHCTQICSDLKREWERGGEHRKQYIYVLPDIQMKYCIGKENISSWTSYKRSENLKKWYQNHKHHIFTNNTAVNSQNAGLKITFFFCELQHLPSVKYIILITRKIYVTVTIYH